MKVHTNEYKEQIKEMGRELDSLITFESTELGAEQLNSVTPSFESSLLKSAMKMLEIDSNVEIPKGSVVNYKFGVKVNGVYEYLNFGNYIVKEVEKQEDTLSYKIVCYDKMLNTMKEYTTIQDGVFPMTIRDYINSLCLDCGLTFKNISDEFANYDKIIESDLYANLGYTYRDIFDELSAVTGSTICLDNEDNLEVRYITDTLDTIDEEYLKDINVNFGEKYGPVNSIVLSRSGESDNVYLQDEESVATNGLTELKIIDNQIMNFNNRADFLPDLLSKLNGLEYYLNDFSSTGISYYDICDRYNVKVYDKEYSCVMFNNEMLVTQGLEENIFTERPKETETDYKKSDKDDRRINQAFIIVDKQNQNITALASKVSENETTINTLTTKVTQNETSVTTSIEELTKTVESNNSNLQTSIDNINSSLANGVEVLKNTLVTIDINGISVSSNLSAISTLMSNDRFSINSKSGELFFVGYDYDLQKTVSRIDNLTVTNYFTAGYHRTEKFEVDGEKRTGDFYVGGEY